MELKQIKSFMAVVDCGNFTKAAERTFISQPTISTHIKALEEELGARLLDRDTKNLRVTPKGREFYEFCVNLIDMQNTMLRKWADEDDNMLRIGASTIPSAYIMPEIISGFRAQHPDVQISLTQGDSNDVIVGLESGRYDIGLIGMDGSNIKIKCDPFYEDNTVIITSNTPEFAKYYENNELPVDIIKNTPFIFREVGSGTQKIAEQLLEGMGIVKADLNVIARINDQATIKNMVQLGLGISIVSRIAVEDEIRDGKILAFDIPDTDSIRSFYIATRKGEQASANVKEFTKYIKRNAVERS